MASIESRIKYFKARIGSLINVKESEMVVEFDLFKEQTIDES